MVDAGGAYERSFDVQGPPVITLTIEYLRRSMCYHVMLRLAALTILLLPALAWAQIDLPSIKERSARAKQHHIRVWYEERTLLHAHEGKWDSAMHRTAISEFDPSGKLIADSTFGGYASKELYSYDKRGNLIQRIERFYPRMDSAELAQTRGEPTKRQMRQKYWASDHARLLTDTTALLIFRDELQYDNHDSLVRHDEYLEGELHESHLYTYRPSDHKLVQSKEIFPKGLKTVSDYSYDARGRLTSVRENSDAMGKGLTKFVYAGSSDKPHYEIRSWSNKRDSDLIFYDVKGNEYLRYNTAFLAPKMWSKWHVYDLQGRLVKVEALMADSVRNNFDRAEWEHGSQMAYREYYYPNDSELPTDTQEWKESTLTQTHHRYTFYP